MQGSVDIADFACGDVLSTLSPPSTTRLPRFDNCVFVVESADAEKLPRRLEEGGNKGHRPKETVEMMLASTLPLVGQR